MANPLTFQDIQALFNTAQQNGMPPEVTLAEFANIGARMTGREEFKMVANASGVGNSMRELSAGIDQVARATPADEFFGSSAGWLFDKLGGDYQTGYNVGAEVPRMAIDTLPMMVGGALGGVAGGFMGGPPGAAAGAKLGAGLGTAASGALMALNTFEDTDNMAEVGLSAATPWLANKLFSGGSNLALKSAQKSPLLQKMGFQGGTPIAQATQVGLRGEPLRAGSELTGRMLETVKDKALSYVGGQVGVGVGLGAIDAMKEGPGVLTDPNYWLGQAVGQIPFLPMDLLEMRGNRWVGQPTVNEAPVPAPVFTQQEQATRDFEKAFAGAKSEAEKAIMEARTGMDVASKVVARRRTLVQNELMRSRRQQIKGELVSDWTRLKAEFPGLPEMDAVLAKPDILEMFPAAKPSMDRYIKQVNQLNKERKSVLRDLRAKPADTATLFGVATEELKLPETLLNKPADQRTLTDYEAVLKGKLTPQGIKSIQDLHRQRAGLPLLYPEMWEKLKRRTTKVPAAEQAEIVEAATGVVAAEGITTDQKLQQVTSTALANGKSPAEAQDVAQRALIKEAQAIVKKATGRPVGRTEKVKAKIADMEALINQEATKAKTLGSFPESGAERQLNKFVLDAARMISQKDQGDPQMREDMLNVMAAIVNDESNQPLSTKLSRLIGGINTVVKNRKSKENTVPLVDNTQPDPSTQVDTDAANVGKTDDGTFDDDGNIIESEGVQLDDVVDSVIDTVLESNEASSEDNAINNNLLIQIGMMSTMRNMPQFSGMTDAQLRAKLADLPSDKKAQLRALVAKQLGLKLASASDGTITGIQDILPQDQFVDHILERMGYDEQERAHMSPGVLNMLSRFNNPEAAYGTMTVSDLNPTYGAAVDQLNLALLNPDALATLSKKDQLKASAFVMAHENSHLLAARAARGDFGPQVKFLFDDLNRWVATENPVVVKDMVQVMGELWLSPEMRELPGIQDVLRNLENANGSMSPDETLANMLGLYTAGSWEQGQSRADAMTLLPAPLRKAFDWIGNKLQDMWTAARTYIRIGQTPLLIEKSKQIKEIFKGIRTPVREAESKLLEARELMGVFDPSKIFDVQFAKGKFGSVGATGKGEEIFNNVIMRGADLANTYDYLKVPFDRMAMTQERTAADIAYALAPVFGDMTYGQGLKAKKGAWSTVSSSPSLNELFDRLVIHANMNKRSMMVKDANGVASFDTSALSPELRTEMEAFSPQGQQAVKQLIMQMEEGMGRVQDTIVNSKWVEVTDKLAGFIASDDSMVGKHGEAHEVAKGIIEAVRTGDPGRVFDAMTRVQDPELRASVTGLADGFGKLITTLDKGYKQSRWFGSLRRYGPYKAYFKKGEEEQLLSFNSTKEAEAAEQRMAAEGWTMSRVIRDKGTNKSADYGIDGEMKARIKSQEAQLARLIGNLPMQEDVRNQLLEHLDFTADIEKQIAAKDVASLGVPRKFKKGMEELNMIEQFMLFSNAAIAQTHKQGLAAAMNYGMKHPDAEQYASVTDTFNQIYENFRNQTPEVLRQMSKLNAAWFIGFNLPGHMAELAQPLMTHLPELRAKGVGYLEGLGMIKKGQGEILDFYKRAIKDKVWDKKDEIHLWEYWKDPEERDMLKQLSVLDQNSLSSAYQDMGFTQGQLLSAIDRETLTPGQMVAKPFNMYANTSLGLYNKFTQHNQILALLTSYRAARKNGMSHEEAVMDSRIFNRVVNKLGGKASRQALPFKGDGLVGHLAFGLQGYVTGWFGQLATYYRHGFKAKDFPHLSQKEVNNARAAFKGMILAQLAASGIMGFPFMAAGMKLMEEMLGEDIQGEMYRALDEATGDPVIAQTATHGFGGTLGELLGIPVDLHSRFSLGGVGGFNAYDGYSSNSLLGPTAGMIEGLWKMGSKLAQGEGPRAALAAGGPSGVKNIAKALDENLRNDNGEPDDEMEMLKTAMGFRSTKHRKEMELKQIAGNITERNSRELKLAANQVMSTLMLGPDRAKAELHRQTNELLSGLEEQQYRALFMPTLNRLASAVASELESQQMPKDIREVASGRGITETMQTAQAMGIKMPPSTEVQRAMLRQAALEMMGIGRNAGIAAAAKRDQMSQLFEPAGP